jgi:arylsulfatase A-like enzyme
MSDRPNILVIVVDRLGAGWLGPYGNAWVPTPALNRFAGESLLCEFALGDSLALADAYQTYWTGLPRACTASPPWPPLARLAADAGYRTCLVTDSDPVADLALAHAFGDRELLRGKPPSRLAGDVSQTRLAQVFQATAEVAASLQGPSLLWLHAEGPNIAWDAPYELREQLADDDDPAPPRSASPISRELPAGYDPDELLGVVQSYAAEVVAFDESLGVLLEALGRLEPWRNALVAFTSPRGYPLGEHLRIGAAGDSLRGEVLQTPLVLRFPDQRHTLLRLSDLVQGADLFATLSRTIDPQGPTGWGRDLNELADAAATSPSVAIASSEHEIALRSAAWFYRRSGDASSPAIELYAKPDDRCEVNEISGRASDMVGQFEQLLEEFERQRSSPIRPTFAELPEELSNLMR